MFLGSAATERQICNAIWSNMADFCRSFGQIQTGECGNDPDVKWTRSGTGIFNSIVRAYFAPDKAEARVAEITEMVRSWASPFVWRVCTEDTPDDLAELLLAQGWQNARGADHPVTFAGMAMPLTAPVFDVPYPDGLEIRRVTSVDDLRFWPRIFFGGFGESESDLQAYGAIFSELALADPQRRVHYTAYLNDRPVSSCLLYADSGVAGLYAIGTVSEARGQGIGTAITRYALQQAKEMGYEWAILQATDMGAPIYRRLGFRDYGSVRILVLRP